MGDGLSRGKQRDHVKTGEALQARPLLRAREWAARHSRRPSAGVRLTDREREVLSHIASGLSKKSIARVLGISDRTVDHHCTNIMTKLDIHDRVELTRFAVREGLVTP